MGGGLWGLNFPPIPKEGALGLSYQLPGCGTKGEEGVMGFECARHRKCSQTLYCTVSIPFSWYLTAG